MLYLFIAAALALAYAFVVRPVRRAAKRAALASSPFPTAWREILDLRLPIYALLPEDLQRQLQTNIQIFVGEKHFIGCGGQEITDEIRVTIASQACLLVLNRKTSLYAPLRTILVYPSAYVATVPSSNGSGQGHASVRLGESWTRGSVVLSWDHSRSGASNFHDGRNVVIHEFSHQLDQEDGNPDGAPILESRSCYKTWAQVLGSEFHLLRDGLKKRKFKPLLSEYGATNPAEFFAVASETFFEKPALLLRKHPKLYGALQSYYKVDPATWREDHHANVRRE